MLNKIESVVTFQSLKVVIQKKFRLMITKELNFVRAMTLKYYIAHTKAMERSEQRNCLNG